MEARCLFRNSCTIEKSHLPGVPIPGRASKFGPQPCLLHELKHATETMLVSFKLQARCSSGTGTGTGALQYGGAPVYAAAFARGPGADGAEEQRRVLLVNKELSPNNVTLGGLGAAAGATVHSVEPNGRVSSPSGIATRRVGVRGGNATIVLPPFAVSVLVLEH